MGIYIVIFVAKLVENALATLRVIVVSNGKKMLGAILQGLIGLVWVVGVGAALTGINEDIWKIAAYAIGSFVGSYLGSYLEEKIAMGNNMVFSIIDNDSGKEIVKALRDEGYAVTVLKGEGMFKPKRVLITMVPRKKRPHITGLIKEMDPGSVIISENAFAIHGGHLNTEEV